MVAIRSNEFADELFGLAELIAVGRIDEVAARFGETVEDLFRFRALGPMPPAGTEVASPQR